jgi:hypothetical protein
MKSLAREILACILLFCHTANAQNGHYVSGGRSMGMSDTAITLSDAFSPFNNIGSLASCRELNVYFTSALLYGIPGLLKIAAGLNGQIFKGVGTFNIYRFGDGLFNEHKLGVGYSHQIRHISLGLQLSYTQFKMEGYGIVRQVSFELGGVIKICPEVFLGAYVFWPPRLSDNTGTIGLSTALLKTGLSYRPVTKLMINLEYHHYLHSRRYWTFGIEYVIRERIALRSGMNLEAFHSTFGIGFFPGKLMIDYAVSIHPVLGISHEFSAILDIGKQ